MYGQPAFDGSFARIVADKPGAKPRLDFYRPVQYELVDLVRGKTSVLIDAPLGRSAGYSDAPRAAWSRDEKEVAVAGVFLPPADKGSVADIRRPCVAVVDLFTRRVECVKETPKIDLEKALRLSLSGLEWTREHSELLLRYSTSNSQAELPPERFRREGGGWKSVPEPTAVPSGPSRTLSITVHQSLNEPPVLTATDTTSGRSSTIWDPNPQLATIRLGEASIYHWHDGAGREWTGGLVKPPDFVAGHRYPLVIQTHGFHSDEFLMEGIFTTANAARPMAARGIVVLQVGEITTNALAGPREPFENGTAGYIAAIDQLVGEGIVDPSKIGIIGFSRTGWYVLDSLIHQPERFAAATLAECTYESYGEYIMNADYLGPQRAKGIAEGIGPDPFGPGLAKWISDSPGFNTDKIRVPVFFEFHSPVSVVYGWDVYAALRLQGKPVDLLYFRNGEHVLAKPKERLSRSR